MKTAMLCVGLLAGFTVAASAKSTDKYFYVYQDKSSSVNHYIPSGWMGDYGDLKLNDAYKQDPADGRTCQEWIYNAQAKQGANWAGVYWQIPANNWGEKPGGFDLTGYKRLTVWARAEKTAHLAKFGVGGITGEHGDTDAVEIGPIDLTPKWTKYTIDLSGKNLTSIIGGFVWAASKDDNPDGFKMYLDEIRFER